MALLAVATQKTLLPALLNAPWMGSKGVRLM
jgi:hypothetical protein